MPAATRTRWLWPAAAAALIVAVDVPWGDVQTHTHWGKVGWIPFVSGPVGSFDILQNLLLGIPLGAAAALFVRPAVPWAGALALAAAAAGEWTQLYSHTRFPSATDIACNMLGAMAAAAAVRSMAATHLMEND